MRDKIVEHIQKHKLIKESQHGFVKGGLVFGRSDKLY